MKLKLGLLHLSRNIKWENWPTWLKGVFLFWPSLGPAYLFIVKTPFPTEGTADLSTLMTNIEYQNYFISVFIGMWSINLVILGLTWILGSLISESYRSYLRKKGEFPKAKIRLTKDGKKFKKIRSKSRNKKLRKLRKKHP